MELKQYQEASWFDRDDDYKAYAHSRYLDCSFNIDNFARDILAQEYFRNEIMPGMVDYIKKYFSKTTYGNGVSMYHSTLSNTSQTFSDKCAVFMLNKMEAVKRKKNEERMLEGLKTMNKEKPVYFDYANCRPKNVVWKETAVPKVKKVIFNAPATIVIWKDDTKTVVKCMEGETYDKEKGLALCFAKKALGNKYAYYEVFKKWLK